MLMKPCGRAGIETQLEERTCGHSGAETGWDELQVALTCTDYRVQTGASRGTAVQHGGLSAGPCDELEGWGAGWTAGREGSSEFQIY